jgi:cyclophilin family peptidyl-prolyl cis-trans isomerase
MNWVSFQPCFRNRCRLNPYGDPYFPFDSRTTNRMFQMNPFHKLVLVACLLLIPVSGCASQEPMSNYFAIETNQGRMVVKLYDETPIHRDNFIKLVGDKFYDGTSFHRVIAGFMIQGGDPNSKDDDPYNDGMGDPGYTLEAEISSDLINRRGALVAARQGDQVNPDRRSSGSQFYVVQGRPVPEEALTQSEQQISMAIGRPFSYTDAQRDVYTTLGGAPWLDMQYSVFGELVEGFDVLDRIAMAPTPGSTGQGDPRLRDMPLERIEMTITRLAEYTPAN